MSELFDKINPSFLEHFTSELLVEWFLYAFGAEFESTEVVLYNPECPTKTYSAYGSRNEDRYILYQVLGWDEEPDGTIVPSVLEEVNRYPTVSDLCRSAIQIAVENQLRPRIGYFSNMIENPTEVEI